MLLHRLKTTLALAALIATVSTATYAQSLEVDLSVAPTPEALLAAQEEPDDEAFFSGASRGSSQSVTARPFSDRSDAKAARRNRVSSNGQRDRQNVAVRKSGPVAARVATDARRMRPVVRWTSLQLEQ
jgi:hypothetical protein